VSHLEPDDRFDREWPHALSRELDRIPLPPRRARGRYARRRSGRGPAGVLIGRPAVAVAVMLAAAVGVTAVLGTTGRLPFQAPRTLPQTAHVQHQTNEGLPAAPPAPTIQPSLAPIQTAPVGTFSYTWNGTPAAPLAWTPGAVDDWDLLASTDFPSDQGGTMQGRFGADCSPPPATHTLRALADSAYLCRGQLMTAIDGGGDAPKTYGGVVFSPAQLADLGQGTSTIGWQVSTLRSSANDWWDVWLTPFDENLVAPVAPGEAPAFNGVPADAVHVRMNNGTCPGSGQPATLGTTNGVPIGTVFNVEVFANHRATRVDGPGFQPCLESAVGRVTADTMGSFRLEVSQGHVRLSVARAGGGAVVLADAQVKLPFQQAVVQFAHHSFDPVQACGHDGTCGPNTYRWSSVSINPSIAFTMLRPPGGASVHGQSTTLRLPQPAPAGSHLRFYAFGSTRVGFDGHAAQPAAAQPGQEAGTGEASYWVAVPAGATSVTLSGTGASGLPWWVLDAAVWAPP